MKKIDDILAIQISQAWCIYSDISTLYEFLDGIGSFVDSSSHSKFRLSILDSDPIDGSKEEIIDTVRIYAKTIPHLTLYENLTGREMANDRVCLLQSFISLGGAKSDDLIEGTIVFKMYDAIKDNQDNVFNFLAPYTDFRNSLQEKLKTYIKKQEDDIVVGRSWTTIGVTGSEKSLLKLLDTIVTGMPKKLVNNLDIDFELSGSNQNDFRSVIYANTRPYLSLYDMAYGKNNKQKERFDLLECYFNTIADSIEGLTLMEFAIANDEMVKFSDEEEITDIMLDYEEVMDHITNELLRYFAGSE